MGNLQLNQTTLAATSAVLDGLAHHARSVLAASPHVEPGRIAWALEWLAVDETYTDDPRRFRDALDLFAALTAGVTPTPLSAPEGHDVVQDVEYRAEVLVAYTDRIMEGVTDAERFHDALVAVIESDAPRERRMAALLLLRPLAA